MTWLFSDNAIITGHFYFHLAYCAISERGKLPKIIEFFSGRFKTRTFPYVFCSVVVEN